MTRKSGMILSRKGRCGVHVRIVGEGALGWLEAAESWGCGVQAMVVGSGVCPRAYKRIMELVSDYPTPTPLATALTLPPYGEWKGLMLATITNRTDAELVDQCFTRWRPWVAILAFPCGTAQSFVRRHLPSSFSPTYRKKEFFKCFRTQFGGVTSANGHFVHLARRLIEPSLPSLMTMKQYQRPLQTALDDVQSGSRAELVRSFDAREDLGNSIFGTVRFGPGSNNNKPVYTSKGVGPDISLLDDSDIRFWVQADSVFSKIPVIRKVRWHELLGIWDYEGKMESRRWTDEQTVEVLRARLRSPPAKMLRLFLSTAASAFVEEAFPVEAPSHHRPAMGMTKDIPFSPLEVKTNTRVAATQADDAEADLSNWWIPEEVPPPDGQLTHLSGEMFR